MKIAVPFDNGEIFPHFGQSGSFKLYETNENSILSAVILETGETGHEALAALLKERGAELLICDGIGDNAIQTLTKAGIIIYAGVSGNADDAVEAYLSGAFDEAEEGRAPEGCEGCSGCGPQIQIEGRNVGKTCRVHYRGTLNDGTQFDSSYDRGEPLEFICGAGMMIPGFDQAVAGMDPGQIIDVHLMPEEAYGYRNPAAVMEIAIADLPGSETLSLNQRVMIADEMNRHFPVTVTAKDDTYITLDANPPMAGKELNFTIELVSAE